MDLVSIADVGSVALARMIRCGILFPLSPGLAAPIDLPVTRVDRVVSFGGTLPNHVVVSGLGGLWVHAGGDRPTVLDLVGQRGLHRSLPGTHPDGWILRFHSGKASEEPAETIGGRRIASPARCLADALRWAELAVAIPTVIRAVRSGVADRQEVRRLIQAENPSGCGASRQRNVWAEIDRILP